jgi:hypothetical protein
VKFPESKFAHWYLDGFKGIEIGPAAHNPFGLNTINVERFRNDDPRYRVYADAQMQLCGEVAKVDVVAQGNKLPFTDKSYDFVISSHVIEHFYNPIGALFEWHRVARRDILIICPHPTAAPSDRDKPITPMRELLERHANPQPADSDEHHTRWTLASFLTMCRICGWNVVDCQDNDDKVGNGFAVVLRTNAS